MVGNLVHEHIQHLLKAREGIDFRSVLNEEGISVRDTLTELYITGRIDTLITPMSGEPYLLEFKSVSDLAFKKKLQIQLSHKYQTMLYLHSAGLKQGYIVYINKEDMQVKVFPLAYDAGMFDHIMCDARYLYRCLLDKQLPPKRPMFDWECNLCIFSDICKQHETNALMRRLFPNRAIESGTVGNSSEKDVKPDA
jgi:CRISPR/Cas system-associated exonuclease Cas4 (RecB family)